MKTVINFVEYNNDIYRASIDKGFSDVQARIIASNIDNVNEIDMLTDIKLGNLPAPTIIPGLDRGADIVIDHINRGSTIALVTDYDADGSNSMAVLYKALVNIFGYDKNKIVPIINERINGNGIGIKLLNVILNKHLEKKIDLIITADHGSANGPSIAKLKENGIDVVVTDHHTVPTENSAVNADAFVNPHITSNNVYKHLSGCAVAFMLITEVRTRLFDRGLIKDLKREEYLSLFSYVAVSTIGDSVNLADYSNRTLTKIGLNYINTSKDNIWSAVRISLNTSKKFVESDVGFKIVPAINAASRMGNSEMALKFLLADSFDDSLYGFNELMSLNTKRRQLQNDLLVVAEAYYKANKYVGACIVYLEKGGLGINGILSSQLGNKYNVPAVVFVDNGDGTISGSGRAILEDFDMIRAFRQMDKVDDSIFVRSSNGQKLYGGHKGAAGCTIYKDKLPEFGWEFTHVVTDQLGIDGANKRSLNILKELNHAEITMSLIDEVYDIGPYGMGFKAPLFVSTFTVLTVVYNGVNNSNLTVTLQMDNDNSKIMGFMYNISGKVDRKQLSPMRRVRVVFFPTYENRRGKLTMKLEITAIDVVL